MPQYEVDVKGNGNNVPTHLTVITDRGNSTRVMKRRVATNNGNEGIAPTSNESYVPLPAPHNFTLERAEMPQLSAGINLPPLNQTRTPTRTMRKLTRRTAAENVMLPPPTPRPQRTFQLRRPKVQTSTQNSALGGRRKHRKHRTHRKHGKQSKHIKKSNHSKKRK
jgi:hypothetical protein